MQKLLLAVNSDILRQALTEKLEGMFHIVSCGDGLETVELLHSFVPDIIVLDLLITGVDGLSILKIIRDTDISCQTVPLTSVFSDPMLYALEDLRVAMLLRTPVSAECVASAVLEVSIWQKEEKDDTVHIRDILTRLGCKLSTQGYQHTVRAVLEMLSAPNLHMTTQLYPTVAQHCGGTAKLVERSIRNAIEYAWKHRNECVWRMYFPVNGNGSVPRPSNAEFLSVIAECVRKDGERTQKDSCEVRRLG
jgi:two-component system response regulator (stage 0 sporulation protein A)